MKNWLRHLDSEWSLSFCLKDNSLLIVLDRLTTLDAKLLLFYNDNVLQLMLLLMLFYDDD